MAKATIIGNRQIDPDLTNRFAQSLANATQKLDSFAQSSGSFTRQSYTPVQYAMDKMGYQGGSFTRKSYTPAEYQKTQQDALGLQAYHQGNIPTAQKAGGMEFGKDEMMQAASKFNTRTSDVGGIDKMDVVGAAMGDPKAMVNLAVDAAQHAPKNWQAAGEHFGKAATSQTAFGAASEGVRGIGSGVSATLGPVVGPEVEKVFKFGAAILETTERIKKWGDSLHQANMQFAEFSGSMAAVQARSEVRDMQLSQRRGERRAESAEALAVAKNRFERATAPIDDAWNNLQNRVATWMLETMAPVIEKLGEWLGLQDEEMGQNENTWMEQTFNEKWFETHGRPQRFKK